MWHPRQATRRWWRNQIRPLHVYRVSDISGQWVVVPARSRKRARTHIKRHGDLTQPIEHIYRWAWSANSFVRSTGNELWRAREQLQLASIFELNASSQSQYRQNCQHAQRDYQAALAFQHQQTPAAAGPKLAVRRRTVYG